MATIEHRCNTRRAEQRIERWIAREPRHRGSRIGIGRCCGIALRDEPHVCRRIRRVECGGSLELRVRYLVQLRRELVRLKSRERTRQDVDRVIGTRARAVAAGIRRFQAEGGEHLLAGIQRKRARLAARQLHSTTIGVERILRVDERALIREQPLHAFGRVGFLIGGEHRDDVAVGHPSLPLPTNQIGDEHGDAGLVVLRAAAEEVAVFSAQHEGIVGPVRALGFHDVQMCGKEDRLPSRRRAPETNDEILILVVRPHDVDVARGVARRDQARLKLARERRGAAGGRGGVRVDRLGDHVSRETLILGWEHARARGRTLRSCGRQRDETCDERQAGGRSHRGRFDRRH